MPQIKHLVLLKYKPSASKAQIDKNFADLGGLQAKIPGILDFAGGPYSSGEGLNQGYTHGFAMTFSTAAARDAYLPHPEHETVKQSILPLIDGVIAFDFEA